MGEADDSSRQLRHRPVLSPLVWLVPKLLLQGGQFCVDFQPLLVRANIFLDIIGHRGSARKLGHGLGFGLGPFDLAF
jgi:hypothetical protein